MTHKQKQVLESFNKGNKTVSKIAISLDTTVTSVRTNITRGGVLGYTEEGRVYLQDINNMNMVELSTDEKIEQMRKELELLEEQSRLEHQTKTLVNLTRHPVVIDNKYMSATYPPSGVVCRVNTKSVVVDKIDGVPIREDSYCELVNFPNKEGEIYIVSGKVGSVLHKLGHTNYLMSDTKRSVIEKGKIKSVENFWRYPKEDVKHEEK